LRKPPGGRAADAGVDFGDDLIWDPCCGRGNVLDVAKRYGHPTIGSDMIDRKPRHRFIRGNVLTQMSRDPALRRPGDQHHLQPALQLRAGHCRADHDTILERFTVRRAAFIVPIAFLASQDRWSGNKFAGRWKPSTSASIASGTPCRRVT
jgi:hypothetical protein